MAEKSYVVSLPAVQESLAALRQLKVHRTFPGYLCVRETARFAGKRSELKPNFSDFFDRYLKIGDASPSSPYAVPFNDRGSPLWFNRNVAGSYAPSSLRPVSPLRQAVDIFGAKASHTFALKDDDAALCFHHLLHQQRIPALPLAVFLFRDHALESESMPDEASLISVFRDQFGFRANVSAEDADFNTLFEVGALAKPLAFLELK